jgi:DNA-binding Lrp family transcriptional regulator
MSAPRWAPISPTEEAEIRERVRGRDRDVLEALLWIRRNIKDAPTYRELADVARCSRDEAGRSIRKLEAAGLLTRIEVKGQREGGQ